MLVTLVHVHVLPDHVADFIEATRPNHAGAVAEPGCFRFDVLQAPDDPTRFVLYEAYRDAAAAAAHEGEIVLLAPACSSFDQFESYEHRGRVFKELVAARRSR